MNAKIFVDTNVLLYLFSTDVRKKLIAESILGSSPTISTQVIAESITVLLKKFKFFFFETVAQHKANLERYCNIALIDRDILSHALLLKKTYSYQWYDCVIVGTALASNCATLYSEDMHHGQIIEERLTIVNPFLQQ